MRPLILGTRGSLLALWQARHVATLLRRRDPELKIVERVLRTEGDAQQTIPLGPGDRGVFVRQIETALLAGTIDFAVHSLKDLPTEQPAGLAIAAVTERVDPRDALLTRDGADFAALAPGTELATGSYRRRTQLLNARPDLRAIPVRGNVDTRVRRLREGRYEALVLASAGIRRLGLDDVPSVPLDEELCLPAVGQGSLAIEVRENDAEARERVAALEHDASRVAATAERRFLQRLGGGCLAPATAFGRIEAGQLHLRAVVGDADGTRLLREETRGDPADAAAAGRELAERLLEAGAATLLEDARAAAERDGAR
jgi:hydroxymethylbilane synthase